MIAFIDQNRDRFGVEPICEVLNEYREGGFITARGYRAAQARPLSARARRHEKLGAAIKQIWEENYCCYGVRKMWAALRRESWDVGRDQVGRITRALGIKGKIRGKSPVTTRPARRPEWRTDLVKRNFHPNRPLALWVADITYVKIIGGACVYTAFVTDCYSRKSWGGPWPRP